MKNRKNKILNIFKAAQAKLSPSIEINKSEFLKRIKGIEKPQPVKVPRVAE